MADVFVLKNIAGSTTLFSVDDSGNVTAAGTISTTGTDDFGTNGIKADVIAESTSAAGVTIDGMLVKDKQIEVSALATGEPGIKLPANKADAFSIYDSTGDMMVLTTTTATPGIAETFVRTAAGNAHAVTSTWNSASATGVGLSVSAAQITTARTSGTLTGVKSAVTSLSGDTAGVDYYAYEASVTAGQATADHFVMKIGAGFDNTFDASACATTEAGWLVGANLADAWHLKGASLTYAVLRTTTATPGIDETFALTAAGDAHNIAATINHATGIAEGLDVSIAQITTARTGGTISAVKASVTSLTGSTAGTDHYAYEAAVTVGEATADHFVLKQGAGFDWSIDSSAAATTEAGWLVASDVADALHIGNGTLTYLTLATTTASPGISEAWAHTGTAAGHLVAETINHATQVGVAVDATAAQLTTARTAGYAAAYRGKTTSLAADNGALYAVLYALAPTDGGGTAAHVGLYDAGNDYGAYFVDNVKLGLGTGASNVPDDAIQHDGTNTVWTHTTGDLVFDNTDTNDQIVFRLGTDTSATGLEIRNDSDAALLNVTADGAVTIRDDVTSGTMKRVGGYIARSSALGASHTASTDETALAITTIPANTIKAGTVVRVRWKARVTADNGATTLTCYLRLTTAAAGTGGTALVTSAAVDTSSGHVFHGWFELNGHAAPGAAASVVGVGSFHELAASPGGTATGANLPTGTTFATNGALYLALTGDWSAADANSVQAEIWNVEIIG